MPEVVPAPSHPHPTPPHPGEDVPPERRKQERLFLHAKAELRLKKGLIYHGRTRELDETGVIFLPERPITGVTIGDRGIFSFILEGGAREFFTEFPCEITKLVEETIYIHFYQSAGNRPGTMRPGELRKGDLDLVKPGSTVCVYRQGGKVEGGWVVLEPDVKLPPNIQSSYEAKEIEGSCVVCRKKSPTKDGQDMYKVYFILDLMAIQIQVTKDAVDQNKAANQNTNN